MSTGAPEDNGEFDPEKSKGPVYIKVNPVLILFDSSNRFQGPSQGFIAYDSRGLQSAVGMVPG